MDQLEQASYRRDMAGERLMVKLSDGSEHALVLDEDARSNIDMALLDLTAPSGAQQIASFKQDWLDAEKGVRVRRDAIVAARVHRLRSTVDRLLGRPSGTP